LPIKCPKCGSEKLVKDGTAHENAQRWKCQSCKDWGGTQPIGKESVQAEGIDKKLVARLHERLLKATRVVITSAQNATPGFGPGLKSLLNYCKVRDALLLVIPYRYKNATSQWTEKNQADDWWTAELMPHLYNRRHSLNKHLMILGDIMTQPTATSPLQGFETISGRQSAIIGHPKLQLKCVPTPQASLPKILTTSCAITQKNYVQAKAGKKGEFHHTFGACVVELDGDTFHMRQINMMKDGSFIDLDTEYDGDRVESGIRLEALTMGDTHEEFVSPDVVTATFGKGGIVPTLKPKKLVWHDLHDFYSRNHHHRGNPFTQIAKQRAGMDDVEAGLRKTFAFLDKHTPVGVESIVVKSNHPDALARWVREADWKTDPVNATFYLRTALAMTEAAQMTSVGAETLDPFKMWGQKWLKSVSRVRFLGTGESYMIKGIDNGFHGHEGANGTRGTLLQFDKVGARTNTGHGHSPGIEGGAWRAGTSTGPLEYSGGGPSSWLNTHIMGYRNGKRSLVNCIGTQWRA
jgi:hypothetical protein